MSHALLQSPAHAATTCMLQIYMCMQNRGADPSIRTEDYDPYLSPGMKLPIEVALEEDEVRGKLKALEKKYAKAGLTCPQLNDPAFHKCSCWRMPLPVSAALPHAPPSVVAYSCAQGPHDQTPISVHASSINRCVLLLCEAQQQPDKLRAACYQMNGVVSTCQQVQKVREPHPDIGCWWTLYDYGLDAVRAWDKTYVHPYPGMSRVPKVHALATQRARSAVFGHVCHLFMTTCNATTSRVVSCTGSSPLGCVLQRRSSVPRMRWRGRNGRRRSERNCWRKPSPVLLLPPWGRLQLQSRPLLPCRRPSPCPPRLWRSCSLGRARRPSACSACAACEAYVMTPHISRLGQGLACEWCMQRPGWRSDPRATPCHDLRCHENRWWVPERVAAACCRPARTSLRSGPCWPQRRVCGGTTG